MDTVDKLLKIEELIGRRPQPTTVSLDEAVEIVYKSMELGLTHGLIKGRLSIEARATLNRYNVEIQTDTYTAGSRCDVSNTLSWNFKHKRNGD
jgi:hypothetical protein